MKAKTFVCCGVLLFSSLFTTTSVAAQNLRNSATINSKTFSTPLTETQKSTKHDFQVILEDEVLYGFDQNQQKERLVNEDVYDVFAVSQSGRFLIYSAFEWVDGYRVVGGYKILDTEKKKIIPIDIGENHFGGSIGINDSGRVVMGKFQMVPSIPENDLTGNVDRYSENKLNRKNENLDGLLSMYSFSLDLLVGQIQNDSFVVINTIDLPSDYISGVYFSSRSINLIGNKIVVYYPDWLTQKSYFLLIDLDSGDLVTLFEMQINSEGIITENQKRFVNWKNSSELIFIDDQLKLNLYNAQNKTNTKVDLLESNLISSYGKAFISGGVVNDTKDMIVFGIDFKQDNGNITSYLYSVNLVNLNIVQLYSSFMSGSFKSFSNLILSNDNKYLNFVACNPSCNIYISSFSPSGISNIKNIFSHIPFDWFYRNVTQTQTAVIDPVVGDLY